MSTITYPQTAAALRLLANNLSEKPGFDLDVAELIRVLARICAGKTIDAAMGAPGDWGYGTPIGDALAADYRSQRPPSLSEALKPT